MEDVTVQENSRGTWSPPRTDRDASIADADTIDFKSDHSREFVPP